jgi:hypothetical protein
MTPRSIRRAAERKAQKLARKAEKEIQAGSVSVLDSEIPQATPEPPRAVSPAQLAANRANAQRSTGPSTAEGRAHSSLNALKTGLTGRTVLLPSDDAEQYRELVRRLFTEYNPTDDKERELVQRLADTTWRLLRVPALESGLFALGRIQFQDMFADRKPEVRAALIDAQSLVAFQKQFNNLNLQESRLLRQLEKVRKELSELQSRRAASTESSARHKPQPARAPDIGFEFSPDALIQRVSVAKHEISPPNCHLAVS